MCCIDRYYTMYHAHLGYSSAYHLRLVRLARALINEHLRSCPECRSYTRSNFNLGKPWVMDRPGARKGEATNA